MKTNDKSSLAKDDGTEYTIFCFTFLQNEINSISQTTWAIATYIIAPPGL